MVFTPFARFRIPISGTFYMFIIIVANKNIMGLPIYFSFLIVRLASGVDESKRIVKDIDVSVPGLGCSCASANRIS